MRVEWCPQADALSPAKYIVMQIFNIYFDHTNNKKYVSSTIKCPGLAMIRGRNNNNHFDCDSRFAKKWFKKRTLNQSVKEINILIAVNKRHYHLFMMERKPLNATTFMLGLYEWFSSKSQTKTLTLSGLLIKTPQISILYFPRFSLIWKSSSSSRKKVRNATIGTIHKQL